MIKLNLDLQKVADKYERPHISQFKLWFANLVDYLSDNPEHNKLIAGREALTLCVRLVEPEEMIKINSKFKHENKETSTLAFPCLALEKTAGGELLGDLVMCGHRIMQEAKDWHTGYKEQWTHMFIHGVLHLFGLEHGREMEAIEIKLLADLGIANPYAN